MNWYWVKGLFKPVKMSLCGHCAVVRRLPIDAYIGPSNQPCMDCKKV